MRSLELVDAETLRNRNQRIKLPASTGRQTSATAASESRRCPPQVNLFRSFLREHKTPYGFNFLREHVQHLL
jgi:hypothetical protein